MSLPDQSADWSGNPFFHSALRRRADVGIRPYDAIFVGGGAFDAPPAKNPYFFQLSICYIIARQEMFGLSWQWVTERPPKVFKFVHLLVTHYHRALPGQWDLRYWVGVQSWALRKDLQKLYTS